MLRRNCTIWLLLLLSFSAFAQDAKQDSNALKRELAELDTTIDYDELFDDLDKFLDSLLMPSSYFNVAVSMSRGYYNYRAKSAPRIRTIPKWTYVPTVAYYHKKGLGIAASAYIINDSSQLNAYQFSLTGSYDYLSTASFATGISYTRFFSKDSLNFYVSPLQNEANAYFTLRKTWIRPSLLVSYAWGTRGDLEKRLNFIKSLRLRRRVLNYLQAQKADQVNDFSLTLSALHDFYWLHVLSDKGAVRITPQLLVTSGTQQYGYNISEGNYTVNKAKKNNQLTSAREFNLDNKKEFKPLSLGFNLRTEYSIHKFFIQPQLGLDYYFPADTDNLSVLFSLNTGFNF